MSNEVGAALGAFVAGGVGPKHSALTRVFGRTGYGDAAPYDSQSVAQQMNKEDRVRVTVAAAVADPHRSKDLISELLAEYRVAGLFDVEQDPRGREQIVAAQRAFARIDWELTSEGVARPSGPGSVVSVAGRPAIEEQLERLRRATDDPALLLGTAKEMLESTAKYVLEEFSVPYRPNMSFTELWYHARDRLGIHPKDVDVAAPGGKQVQEILQSSWTIANMVNEIRNDEGTGHGRTLPTALSPDMAMLVVREAASVTQMVLGTLDRQRGR